MNVAASIVERSQFKHFTRKYSYRKHTTVVGPKQANVKKKGMTKAMARERLYKYEFGFRVQATNEMVHTNRIEETVFLEYMKHFETS